MSAANYDEAIRRVLVHEGGYSNHPSDPGGPTNFGITIYDYRKYLNPKGTAADVRNMSVEQAKRIYRNHYAVPLRFDELPGGVDYCVLDYGINSGIGRSKKVLQRVVGVAADGVLGPLTMQAIAARDPAKIVTAICDERLAFLKRLKTWPVFGKGWTRRVAEVRSVSLRMVTERAPSPSIVPAQAPVPGKGALPVPAAAKKVIVGTGTATPVAAGSGFSYWIAAHPFETAAIGCGLVLVVGGSVYALNRWHQGRQEAAIPETPVVPALAAA
jgi:lysozyme family protein